MTVRPVVRRHILIENCHQGGLDPPGNPVTNSETQRASSPPYVNRDHPGDGNTQGNCTGTTRRGRCSMENHSCECNTEARMNTNGTGLA